METQGLWEWAKKQGLATVLVLLGVGFFAGFIPSPLKVTAEVLQIHAGQMDRFLQESRYQTALLAVMCRQLATPDECLTALMKEHTRGLQTPQDDQAPVLRADPRY